ncbi:MULTISPECIES: ATP-grasp domain-containing protein [Anaerococcus]|uniref:ATP-grasp domain-containing protein n=1 Tax=Anaerococcus TaxID=165779 RepID=UPI00242CEF3E|nr:MULTISPECIES: ATP-grasp domain-containing protein [Anaerococcus]MDD7766758.1 ATP-grasp domain-containing protein [Anaerococcus vaginalis]MDY6127898.1 ATP-grasp domain-containing protein [Anaerococcus sp.]
MILGASILQVPAIEKAINMGLEVVAVDIDSNALGFKIPDVKKEIISTIDIESVMSAAKKHNIDAIMTLASDMPIMTVAKVSKKLGLVGVDLDTAIKATNKSKMRESLKSFGVPVPLFYKVDSLDKCIKAVNKIKDKGYKCILKPADNSGSRGIVLLPDFNEKTINIAYNYSKNNSRNKIVMVEEFMEGPEVSVETISVDGKCNIIQITDKITTGAPYFVEMGHSQPSQLTSNIKDKIKEITISANKAIGIKNGPSHTEIKITKDGPKIVEIGARLGGDNITTHLTPLSTGVDMVESCIRIALGEKIDIKTKYRKASAIRYLDQSYGKIKSIEGIDEARKIPGIKQVSIVRNEGEILDGIKSSSDRIGFVIGQASNCKDAISAVQKALSLIKIDFF